MARKIRILVATLVAAWVVSMFFLWKLDIYWNEYHKYKHRGLPIVEINLNGVTLREINSGNKKTKYSGNELKIYNEGKISEYENVEIKGRGNGTWLQNKKPYQIKFDEKTNLFGKGKSRKWLLLANAVDPTNLRTETAFYLANMLGMEYAYDGQFVEVYIDGLYHGLYYLTHAMEISKQTVDLKDPLGIIAELDNIYGWMEEDRGKSNNGDIFFIKDVVEKDLKNAAMEEFLKSYNALEEAVRKKDYAEVCVLADVQSFAQYYLLNEFSVNPDAYWTSFYMYKDGTGDKIHAGPGWDFDLAFANRVWGNWLGEDFYSPTETMIRKNEMIEEEQYEEMGLLSEDGPNWYEASLSISKIVFDMMEMPEFREEVRRLYLERMAGREDELLWEIEQWAKEIEEPAMINDRRWTDKDYWEEVQTMRDWVKERYQYFDKVYGGDEVILE